MYSREVNGTTRRFGVTGRLWHGVLVMFDRETQSYWTQIDGRAIRGEEQGARLEHVPSVFTTFGSWVDAHPDTLVLDKADDERGQAASNYAEYLADPADLFFEHLGDGLDQSTIQPKDVIFGVRHAGDALAISEATVERDIVVNVVVGDRPVALLRNSITGEVRGVSRTVDGTVHRFEPVARYEATERIADADSGRVFKVDELEPIRVDRAFWYAWGRTIPGARTLD